VEDGTEFRSLKDIESPDPSQMTNQLVVDWFAEIGLGERQPRQAEVSIAQVRANPFAPMLDRDVASMGCSARTQ
jgi:hypothetical protein